jgi:hypothetical protein
MVCLQVGRASEITYERLWPGRIHGESGILSLRNNKFGIGNGILLLSKKRRNSLWGGYVFRVIFRGWKADIIQIRITTFQIFELIRK